MPVYIWEATTPRGESRSGTITAESEANVAQRLITQGLVVGKIKKKPIEIQLPKIGTGVSLRDKVVFARTFSTMIDAGLPIVQSLDMLASQSESIPFRRVLSGIKAEVESGKSLSEAMGSYPKVFDDLFRNLVAAGEQGGILDVIFRRLAVYLEKAAQLRRQLMRALIYPSAILVVGILVVIVMMTRVLPVFERMFKDLGAGSLPAPTRVVLAMSHAVSNNWILLSLATVIAIVFVTGVLRTRKGRYAFDSALLKMPLFGPVVRKIAVARFTRTLGTLLNSGVPILDALGIVSKTSGNLRVSEAIDYARSKIEEGKDIASPLVETGVFPPMVIQMIGVGEQTGAMDDMLQKIADFYEDEVDMAVGSLTSLIGPVMVVFLGGAVGGMLIAMYMPIFEVAGNIQ